MAEPLSVLGIAGSLRAGSYNRALLRAARELAPAGIEVTAFDLRPIPMYDGDAEREGDPEPVTALKHAIKAAAGLLVVTPEYNHSIPGVLKNALDWASRPALGSPLAGKPVAIAGASTGLGGTRRAQDHLRQALAFPRALVLDDPKLCVPEAYARFDEHGRLVDQETVQALRTLLEALRTACVPEPARVRVLSPIGSADLGPGSQTEARQAVLPDVGTASGASVAR